MKQWFKSKTINFGILLQMAALVQTYYEDIGNPLATMIVGLIVIWLRFKTTQPVSGK